MIVTRKPTGEEWMDRKNGIEHENIQDSYSIYKAAMGKKNPWPVTSSQEIGWDAMPLVLILFSFTDSRLIFMVLDSTIQ
jgi:hypothetical protein